MRVLFLYTELAAYFIRCCEKLAEHADVHIVRWPVNAEAPFAFEFPRGVTVYERKEYDPETLQRLVKMIDPSMIVCSGWIDKGYLAAVGKWARKIPTVLALDTKWTGSARQQVARLAGRLLLGRRFSHAWVPGGAQLKYARRLGFPVHRIRTGFYSCDLDRFNDYYNRFSAGKKERFPKRFVFTGRYYAFKGVEHLWRAFGSLTEEERKGWELWCAGTGSIKPAPHHAIRHFGFVQPSQLDEIMEGGGVFILPSTFEPWAVVVHEFAAAGFPLALSTEVGAAETFLKEGHNGFSFKAGDETSLKATLKKVIALSDKDLFLMAERSHTLAQENSPHKWARTALDIINGWHNK